MESYTELLHNRISNLEVFYKLYKHSSSTARSSFFTERVVNISNSLPVGTDISSLSGFNSDTFTIFSSHLDCFTYSFFPRTISEWNKLSQDVRSKPSIVSCHSALLKTPGPVENNF